MSFSSRFGSRGGFLSGRSNFSQGISVGTSGSAIIPLSSDPRTGAGAGGAAIGVLGMHSGDLYWKFAAGVNAWMPLNAHGITNWFGDGSAGDLSVTGGTTTEAATLGDVYYNDGTITSTGIYAPAGRTIWFNGTLDLQAGGIIDGNGLAASGATGGLALANNGLIGGAAGASGGTGAGSNGSTHVHHGFPPDPTSEGGAGGAGSGGAGGAGGQLTYSTSAGSIRQASTALQMAYTKGLAQNGIAGGTGGGAGGGNGAQAGGGGGGGARNIVIVARELKVAGTIRAAGGAGAAGLAANAGGGGGGGGGIVLLIYGSLVESSPTYTVTGGAAGASGGGSGVAGTAGSDGAVLKLQI